MLVSHAQRIALLVAAVAVVGCVPTAKPVGTETMVESSGEKPEWVLQVPEDEDEVMFWVGRNTGADSEDGAITDAREEVGRQMADFLQSTSTKLYEKARTQRATSEDLGPVRPFVNDTYKSWYEKVKTQGLRTKQVYWERWEKVLSPERVRYLYRGYVLMTIDKTKLIALGQQAIDEQLAKARAAADRDAEEALEQMKAKIDELKR